MHDMERSRLWVRKDCVRIYNYYNKQPTHPEGHVQGDRLQVYGAYIGISQNEKCEIDETEKGRQVHLAQHERPTDSNTAGTKKKQLKTAAVKALK
jgi:hypothetical protein